MKFFSQKTDNTMATDQPLVTQAYVCPAKGEKFVLQDITLPPMKPTMVELDMTYCGLCHTDIHMRGKTVTLKMTQTKKTEPNMLSQT